MLQLAMLSIEIHYSHTVHTISVFSCSELLVNALYLPAGGAVPVKDSIKQELTTMGSQSFLQFAMSPTEVGDDVYLYEQLIEPALASGLLKVLHPYLRSLMWTGPITFAWVGFLYSTNYPGNSFAAAMYAFSNLPCNCMHLSNG